MKNEIKLKIEAPRVEIALGSASETLTTAEPYVVVAILHLANGELLYQPLAPIDALQGALLDIQVAGDFLAELYDFICQRWGSPNPH